MLINMNKSFEDGIMNFQKSIEESTMMSKELKAKQLVMEAQIVRLASSSITWQIDSSPPTTQIEDGTNTIILASDEECDSFWSVLVMRLLIKRKIMSLSMKLMILLPL